MKVFVASLVVVLGMLFAHYDMRKESRINNLMQDHIARSRMLVESNLLNGQLNDQIGRLEYEKKILREQNDELVKIVESIFALLEDANAGS